MKIAVSAAGPSLDDQVDPRFGRCENFLIVEIDTMEFEVAANTGASSGHGAGIAAAQMIADKGVEAVLTGNCGPNAFGVLNSAGIKVITGVGGAIREAIESYKAGKLKPDNEASVDAHSGSGRGRGMR
jgi:predicted Fe-Mo cluster-binding NifX family protein